MVKKLGRGRKVYRVHSNDLVFGGDGLRDELPDRVVEVFLSLPFAGGFYQGRAYGLEEGDVVAQADGFIVSGTQGEGTGDVGHDLGEASLPVFLLQDVFLTGGQQAEPFGRRAGHPFRPVEAVHQVAADFVLLQPHGVRLSRVDDGRALAAALGVGGQRLLQLIGQSEVIDDQPALLVAEDSVYASDGLHQTVSAHRLVGVHRVEAGGVEAGQPISLTQGVILPTRFICWSCSRSGRSRCTRHP